ncbi:ATP-grasp fold amidoligase family protein [Kiritimatiellota bacterium B12222]|nr:ATP-grasp fold amidoligase family protein [Kiritimatiellota bacterium B12222]
MKTNINVSLIKCRTSVKRIVGSAIIFALKFTIIYPKWWIDKKGNSALTRGHFELYNIIQSRFLLNFGRFADVKSPELYNDKIQWLKLFDQKPDRIICCDKLLVRSYVEKKCTNVNFAKVYQTAKSFAELDINSLPQKFVLKTNHDSGTVFIIRDKMKVDWAKLGKEVENSLAFNYGWLRGEWPYKFIDRKVFVEELLDPMSEKAPPDFKFHCVNGRVMWLQYLFDRGENQKEKNFDRKFKEIPLNLDTDFSCSEVKLNKPKNWNELVLIAEKISKDIKYVRVDLYNIESQVFFGEMTFYPKSGLYKGGDNDVFGGYLNFDKNKIENCFIRGHECFPKNESDLV